MTDECKKPKVSKRNCILNSWFALTLFSYLTLLTLATIKLFFPPFGPEVVVSLWSSQPVHAEAQLCHGHNNCILIGYYKYSDLQQNSALYATSVNVMYSQYTTDGTMATQAQGPEALHLRTNISQPSIDLKYLRTLFVGLFFENES